MSRRFMGLLVATLVAACSGAQPATPSGTAAGPSNAPPTTPPAPTDSSTIQPMTGPAPAGRIVFGRQTGSEGWQVLVIGADGSGERQLLAGVHDVTRVSHDGKHIASVSFGETAVFPTIFDSEGVELGELHPDKTLNLGAMAWSRDDAWLAFEAWDDSDHSRDGIWLVRADGTGLKRLTDSGIPGDFGLDDRELVFTRDGQGTFVINIDGTGERKLSDMSGPYPGYLPDGRIYAGSRQKLWLIEPATGMATPMEIPGGAPIEPRISRDGSVFAFSFDPDTEDSIGIWTMNVDGSNLRRVVNTAGIEEVFPDWLP